MRYQTPFLPFCVFWHTLGEVRQCEGPQAEQVTASCLCSGLGRGVCSAAAGRRWRSLEASSIHQMCKIHVQIGTMAEPWRNHGGTMAEARRNHGGTTADGVPIHVQEPKRNQAEPRRNQGKTKSKKVGLYWPGHDFVDVSYSHTADGTKRNQGGTNVKSGVCVGQAKTSTTRALATPSLN